MSIRALVSELFVFGWKEARACIFAVSLFAVMLLSYPASNLGIARYDFIFVGALVVQAGLVLSKQETWREVLIISLFHVVGIGLELFKTHPEIASWTYPEASFFRIGQVPLYSGFMYAAVGSYVLQAWKLLRLKFTQMPPLWLSSFFALTGYINFFTKHFIHDIRWWIIAGVFIIFSQTSVFFTAHKKQRSMPLVASFGLIAFFIWIAENIATALGAWQYTNQTQGWHLVHPNKISSWFLLFIISFLLVVSLKKFTRKD